MRWFSVQSSSKADNTAVSSLFSRGNLRLGDDSIV